MKIFEEKLVNTEVDRICDVCGESVMVKLNGHQFAEYGELNATFGFGSKQDGNVYHLDLCEKCFMTALHALKEHRRSILMFDNVEDLANEDFGLDLDRTNRL